MLSTLKVSGKGLAILQIENKRVTLYRVCFRQSVGRVLGGISPAARVALPRPCECHYGGVHLFARPFAACQISTPAPLASFRQVKRGLSRPPFRQASGCNSQSGEGAWKIPRDCTQPCTGGRGPFALGPLPPVGTPALQKAAMSPSPVFRRWRHRRSLRQRGGRLRPHAKVRPGPNLLQR